MKKKLFEVCTFFKYAWRRSSWDTQHLFKFQIQTKHALKSIQQIHVGNAMFWGTGSIGKGLPTSSKPPLSSCKVNSRAETFKLNPFQPWATAFTYQKSTAKEQGHGRKTFAGILNLGWGAFRIDCPKPRKSVHQRNCWQSFCSCLTQTALVLVPAAGPRP